MDKNSAALQKKIQTELDAFNALVKAYPKAVNQKTILESQLHENKCVLDELNLLGPNNKVYKLFGPVLVKQGLEESRQHVGKRIEYISKEIKSSDDTLKNIQKDMKKHGEAVQKFQQQYQVAAAMK